MNPDGGAGPQTFGIASPDGKRSPSEPVAGEASHGCAAYKGRKSHSAQSSGIFQNLIADLGRYRCLDNGSLMEDPG